MDSLSDSNSRYLKTKVRSTRWIALMIRSSLILFLLSTFISQPVLSQEGDPNSPSILPFTIQTVDGPRYFVNMTDRALAFKPNGTPCAAYGGDALYYACYDSVSKTWISTVLDSSTYVGQYTALTFYKIPAGATEAFISYYDAYNGQLKLIYTVFGAWQSPITVPNPAPGTLVEIPHEPETPEVENPNNLPEDQASLEDESVAIKAPWLNIMRENDPTFPITESKGVGKHTSIAVNIRGIYISYYDDREVINDPNKPCSDPVNICERNLKVAYWDGQGDPTNPLSWEFDLVDDESDQGRVGLWSSIALDFDGNMHIAYMSEKYDTLKYAFWNRSKPEWKVKTVDGIYPVTLGSMCSIAMFDKGNLLEDGEPVISYLDFSNGSLKVAKLTSLANNTWNKRLVDNAGNTGWWTSIAVDGDKRIHISYYNATDRDLKYANGRLLNNGSGAWDGTIKTIRPKRFGEGLYSSIALSPTTGRPSIVHLNMTLDRMEHTFQTSSTNWDTIPIDYGADVGFASSLKITSIGFPNIIYLNATAGNLKYALPGIPSTTWATYYPVSGPNIGLYNSLALFNGMLPRIATYDVEHGNAVFGKNSLLGWEFEYVDRTYDVGQFISLAMSSGDVPHMSYYDATHQNLVYATDLGAAGWYTRTLDTKDNVGQYTSIAMSSDDRAYISYFDDTNDQLKMMYQTAPFKFWSDPPEIVDPGGADKVGKYTSIALDSFDYPHISYYDETNKNLKYAHWDGANWILETVPDPDSAGDVGRYTSLVINPADDSRHICYFDYTNKSLKYARNIGAGWEFLTVDNVGDTGYSCSIDLNSAGEPAISYYDNTNADLKIALSANFIMPAAFPYMVFLPIVHQ